MAKAKKMGYPTKTNDGAPTGDAGAAAPDAPSETAELQSMEPSTEEQSGPVPALEAAELQSTEPPAGAQSRPPVPEPKGAEPRSGESPAGAQSGPVTVRYHVLAPVFVNGSIVDPKGRKDVYVFAAPGLEGNALKLAPEGEAGTATAG